MDACGSAARTKTSIFHHQLRSDRRDDKCDPENFEQVAGPHCALQNQNTDCENCLTKPCTSDTSTFPTPCEDANLTAESSASIEPCRTYTPLSTNVCKIATANHKIDMTAKRSDAALNRDVTPVTVYLLRRNDAPLSRSSFGSTQTEPLAARLESRR